MATDPVCLTEVDEDEAMRNHLMFDFDNDTYFFCSEECKKEFEHHAARYTQKDAETRASEEGMPPPADSP